jgi:hypothetical protein
MFGVAVDFHFVLLVRSTSFFDVVGRGHRTPRGVQTYRTPRTINIPLLRSEDRLPPANVLGAQASPPARVETDQLCGKNPDYRQFFRWC